MNSWMAFMVVRCAIVVYHLDSYKTHTNIHKYVNDSNIEHNIFLTSASCKVVSRPLSQQQNRKKKKNILAVFTSIICVYEWAEHMSIYVFSIPYYVYIVASHIIILCKWNRKNTQFWAKVEFSMILDNVMWLLVIIIHMKCLLFASSATVFLFFFFFFCSRRRTKKKNEEESKKLSNNKQRKERASQTHIRRIQYTSSQ